MTFSGNGAFSGMSSFPGTTAAPKTTPESKGSVSAGPFSGLPSTPAKEETTKDAPAKEETTKDAPAKEETTKDAPAKEETPAKEDAPAKEETPAKEDAPAKKPAAKKTAAKKTRARRTSTTKKSAPTSEVADAVKALTTAVDNALDSVSPLSAPLSIYTTLTGVLDVLTTDALEEISDKLSSIEEKADMYSAFIVSTVAGDLDDNRSGKFDGFRVEEGEVVVE